MKTSEVELSGHVKVTAKVTADSPQRAVEIAWNATMEPGETGEYLPQMECFDSDGPTVEAGRYALRGSTTSS